MRRTPVMDFLAGPWPWVIGIGGAVLYAASGAPIPGVSGLGAVPARRWGPPAVPRPLPRRTRPRWNPAPFAQPRPPGVPRGDAAMNGLAIIR